MANHLIAALIQAVQLWILETGFVLVHYGFSR